jgi:hypothetical protein
LRNAIYVYLIAALSCQAQQVSGPVQSLQPAGDLKIIVVQGEGAQNNVRSRSAAPLVVEVRDANDKPVERAEVVFQLPAYGPSGVFNGWMRNQLARTNAEGRAESSGYTPNDEPGRFNIKVTATSGTKTSSAVIAQSNVSGAGTPQVKQDRSKMWKILAVVGAAGLAGGIVAATRGGDSSSSAAASVPITISPGTVTVGGPR